MAALTVQSLGTWPVGVDPFGAVVPVYARKPVPRAVANVPAAALAFLTPGAVGGSGTTFPVAPAVTKVPVQP